MSTGLLIRDFTKQYRELRYANSGSIRFSEIEHNAYRLALTLEVTHVDASRYGNKKTLPDNTHYGYCTLFKGSTVADSISIKYPKFRVFDIINPHIWQYHQNTESKVLQTREIAATVEEGISLGFVSDVLSGEFAVGVLSDAAGWFYAQLTGVWEFWAARLPGGGESEPLGEGDGYRAFPVASPFPSVIKFKGDIPLSFLWRLEAWYLVNPAVYIVDNPTDTGDGTDGEDEYPEPDQGDGDGDGDEFPDSADPDPDSDPRDFNGGDLPAGGTGTWLTYEFINYLGKWDTTIQGNAVFGYPGGLECRPGQPEAYSIWYVWDGGERLCAAIGSPTAIRNFKVLSAEGGEVLYTIIGQTSCG